MGLRKHSPAQCSLVETIYPFKPPLLLSNWRRLRRGQPLPEMERSFWLFASAERNPPIHVSSATPYPSNPMSTSGLLELSAEVDSFKSTGIWGFYSLLFRHPETTALMFSCRYSLSGFLTLQSPEPITKMTRGSFSTSSTIKAFYPLSTS